MRFFDPFHQLDALRREIDRAFDIARTGRPTTSGFLPGRGPRNYPLVNLGEDADNVYMEALAPGLDPDKLELSVMRNQLTLAGEKKGTNGGVPAEKYHRTERAAGKFIRTFSLPAEVDDSRIQAEYRSGILRVTLPKAETAKPRRIDVSVS